MEMALDSTMDLEPEMGMEASAAAATAIVEAMGDIILRIGGQEVEQEGPHLLMDLEAQVRLDPASHIPPSPHRPMRGGESHSPNFNLSLSRDLSCHSRWRHSQPHQVFRPRR